MATTHRVLVHNAQGQVIADLSEQPASVDDDLLVLLWHHRPWCLQGQEYRVTSIDLLADSTAGTLTRVRVERL
jgi:hypothetical protein